MPNFEFIKNKSFEISWAVFRCATLVKQENLRKQLEDSSVELVSKYGNFAIHKENLENLKIFLEIEKLNSLIKLAEAIGEIKIVNARVLHREINNFSEMVKNEVNNFETELKEKDNRDVSIEEIFTEKSASKDQILENKDSQKDQIVKKEEVIQNNNNSAEVKKSQNIMGNSSAMSESNSAEVKGKVVSGVRQNDFNQGSIPDVFSKPVMSFSSVADFAVATKQKFNQKNIIASTVSKSNVAVAESDEDTIQDSWQNLIYRKIKEIGKTSTREISLFFPEISERTVRFYLQKLTDAGFIEKMGTTGPGSFYVYKK